jgi:hypothetical protein
MNLVNLIWFEIKIEILEELVMKMKMKEFDFENQHPRKVVELMN